MKEVLAPEGEGEDANVKGNDLVDDPGGLEVEGGEAGEEDGEEEGDGACSLGGLADHEGGVQHGPVEEEHGELVGEFHG